ncbi:hypothetical protein DHEL01_v202783 [Diaporthe helianthi]|uniref:Uncharacterized protein n=1 Tax=Diaporthe helianthi TaxID=158607 RepID=A0A2P5I8H4_DIAHE|nr:hypothetical protein DHEL01_v202783 [Diaporthe helianthi]
MSSSRPYSQLRCVAGSLLSATFCPVLDRRGRSWTVRAVGGGDHPSCPSLAVSVHCVCSKTAGAGPRPQPPLELFVPRAPAPVDKTATSAREQEDRCPGAPVVDYPSPSFLNPAPETLKRTSGSGSMSCRLGESEDPP